MINRYIFILLFVGLTCFSQEQDSLQIKLSKYNYEDISWFRISKLRKTIDNELLKDIVLKDTLRLNYEFKVDSIGKIHIVKNEILLPSIHTKLKEIGNKNYHVFPFKNKNNKPININHEKYNIYAFVNGKNSLIVPEFRTATFIGCKGDNKALKHCMNVNINKHISKKFNSDLANDLGLSSGKKRIFVRFDIDKEGNVQNIKARAPHPKLQIEGERVISLLPKLIPGSYDGKNIKIPYSIPIVFVVEDSSPVKTKKQIKAEKRRLRN